MPDPRPHSLNVPDVQREELPVDVLLVGAGPANLACAIHLRRLLEQKGLADKSIIVLEKAAEIGDHTLSGAVMNPRGMAELFPDWRERGCPIEADVAWDGLEVMLPKGRHVRLTGPLVPPQLHNKGKVIVTLNHVVRWMKDQAEAAGIQITPGFPAAEILFEAKGAVERVAGVVTRDSGVGKHGEQKASFQPGMVVRAAVTVFGEGPRGNLAKHLVARHSLDRGRNPQTYGTGIKEIWEIPEERGTEWLGGVVHTMGQPLGTDGYGGGWIYGISKSRLSIGYVVGLDHTDARLDPHALFTQWKQHPAVASVLAGGKMLRYGAKTVPEGGYFAMPRLYGEGYVLVGDTGGFLNASTLKGVHLAIKSGLLAAETIAEAVAAGDSSAAMLRRYQELFEASWARDELWRVRNWRQAFDQGLFAGMLDAGVQMITGGRGLVKRRRGHADHTTMRPISVGSAGASSSAARSAAGTASSASASAAAAVGTAPAGSAAAGPANDGSVRTPAFDGVIAFDKLTDVYHSGTVHDEDQPAHLLVVDPKICVERCTIEFGNPCQHFCPAAVYEWPAGHVPAPGQGPIVNFSNCVHCKTCDVADPYQVIEWVVPEGGGGPKYVDM